MWFVKKRKIWFAISGTLVVLSIIFTAVWGLDFGIDFTGGSLAEIRFNDGAPDIPALRETLASLELGNTNVQPTEENTVIFRFQFLDDQKRNEVVGLLEEQYGSVEELRFTSIGPIIGEELRVKTFYAIVGVLVAIILYVAYAFRKVSKPISSWKYGLLTIVAAFHDTIIPIGIFAVLGHFYDFEVNAAFVAALLTIMGYSVNDTIVVFDRVRENLLKTSGSFEEIVGRSIDQTITRSINTSFTTLLALLAIFIFGGETIRAFTGVLIIGIAVGAYSSVFLASPLLVSWERFRLKK